MSINFVDNYTFGHFMFGIISSASVYPKNPLISLMLSNTAHFIMELSEQKVNKKNENILDTTKNKIGDLIFFFLGSIIGYKLYKYTLSNSKLRWVLFSISLAGVIHGIGREVFPYKWPINSAYGNNKKTIFIE